MGVQIILGNTYHLVIRPGLDINNAQVVFTNLSAGICNPYDSGGYQVFSLAKIRKVKAHGVEFHSHIDGAPLFLGPKEAMEIQRCLGSDIAMVF
jgi:queuine tRNA-ribosyltransferase